MQPLPLESQDDIRPASCESRIEALMEFFRQEEARLQGLLQEVPAEFLGALESVDAVDGSDLALDEPGDVHRSQPGGPASGVLLPRPPSPR